MDECKPVLGGGGGGERGGARGAAEGAVEVASRGLHSPTFQFNLSRF